MEDKSVANKFLVGGVYGAIAAIFFSGILIFFNKQFPEYHWISFAVAYGLCFLVAFGMVYIQDRI
jgi:DMSO reductase anchor subunit